jgi:hypothetical protein
MYDPEVEIQRAVATCKTKHECIIMICGTLLGTLAQITGKPYDPDGQDPNEWPRLLVAEMKRVYAMEDRPPAMTEWFQSAGSTLVEMRSIHGLTAPNWTFTAPADDRLVVVVEWCADRDIEATACSRRFFAKQTPYTASRESASSTGFLVSAMKLFIVSATTPGDAPCSRTHTRPRPELHFGSQVIVG